MLGNDEVQNTLALFTSCRGLRFHGKIVSMQTVGILVKNPNHYLLGSATLIIVNINVELGEKPAR